MTVRSLKLRVEYILKLKQEINAMLFTNHSNERKTSTVIVMEPAVFIFEESVGTGQIILMNYTARS